MKIGWGQILFSLALLNRPGTFELSKMDSFSCPNLGCYFFLLKRVPEPNDSF
ncbi:cell division protein ZipA C-terminal FtsZ-binding domain-containing protein [Candidatus Coxiella mudrowiae]|uniref:cell division protein ZipA C-terminal FtsZ-binding domain-containing protein n=1 Tax=Candidatus Coxiella mudrowiae TaxID=2054173 RepID=UPI0024681A10|nr:cell division protein ZipA C-terminal FtsZ-binding domain-containing protein [Candidatus Coxiella mudrowiae]